MTNYSMKVIPKPKNGKAAVLNWSGPKGKNSVIKGEGSDNYLCEACGNVICENVNRGQISGLVISCPSCGSYNVIKGT